MYPFLVAWRTRFHKTHDPFPQKAEQISKIQNEADFRVDLSCSEMKSASNNARILIRILTGEYPAGNRSNAFPSALKHGAYSGTTLLPGEDSAAFKKLHSQVVADLAPTGPLEDDIVESIARLLWRKQNLSTYRLAMLAKNRVSAIDYEIIPQSDDRLLQWALPDTRDPEKVRAARQIADEQARKELGPLLQLVEMGDDVTIERLLEELSVVDRLDGMIDRCLKRLLMVRGVKSMSPSVSETSPPRRKRLTAA